MVQNSPRLDVVVRRYIDNDFPMIESWWRKHHGNDFRPSYPAKESFVVLVDNEPSAFFGMCPMTPAFCYLAFPLCSPELTKDKRELAIDSMLECARLWAVNAGIPIVYYSGNGEKFLSRLREKGWFPAEKECQHMFLKVGEIK